MKERKKVVSYKKPFQINIGLIIFIIIFIYLLYNVYIYMTATHISVYEVEQGTMAENNVYRGLILRDEQVYYSAYSGTVNYYVREGTRVGYNQLVYSVDENGDVSRLLEEAEKDASSISEKDLSKIERMVADFQESYGPQAFYEAYAFRDDLKAALDESISLGALESISEYTSGQHVSSTFHRLNSDAPGIVVYSADGLEDVRAEDVVASMFNEGAYGGEAPARDGAVSEGDPVYKMIKSEEWQIIFPIGDALARQLAGDDTLQLRFTSDGKTTYATYTVDERGDGKYLTLSLKSGMIRYARERFVEVELILDEETGLKIPNSAIVKKKFFTIPKKYFTKGGDSTEDGLLVRRTGEDGKVTTEFVAPTVYYEKKNKYYVDNEELSQGDVVILPNSSNTYQVGKDTAVLKGVYNVNKGYAVFKRVKVLYKSKEYSIVRAGTSYGVALYDHIALDGSRVQENDLI